MSSSNFAGVQVVPLTATEVNFVGNTGGYQVPFNNPGTNVLITVPALGATGGIYLPTAAQCAGSNIEIRAAGTIGHICYIYAPTSVVGGIITQPTPNGPTGSGNLTAASVSFAATAVVGDSIKLTSDGTHFYVDGKTSVSLGITIP